MGLHAHRSPRTFCEFPRRGESEAASAGPGARGEERLEDPVEDLGGDELILDEHDLDGDGRTDGPGDAWDLLTGNTDPLRPLRSE